jgi:hypothetical protein
MVEWANWNRKLIVFLIFFMALVSCVAVLVCSCRYRRVDE